MTIPNPRLFLPRAAQGILAATAIALAAAWSAPSQASSRHWTPVPADWTAAYWDDDDDAYYRDRRARRHWREHWREHRRMRRHMRRERRREHWRRLGHRNGHYRPAPPVATHYPAPAYGAAPAMLPGRCGRQTLGGLIGAATGAVAGANIGKGKGRTVAVAGGTLLGLLVGANVGRTLDRVEGDCVGRVLETVPAGHDVAWTDPDSGTRYEAAPTRAWREPSGRYCREYQTTVYIGGRAEEAIGTACRLPDGSWEVAD